MDTTISTSLSSFKLHSLQPTTPLINYHLKTPSNPQNFPATHHRHISSSTTAAAAVASKSAKLIPRSPSPPTPSHRTAASGYAAALIDAGLCTSSLDAIYKDVKRLLKYVEQNELLKGILQDPSVEEGIKGRVMKEVAGKANFRRHVVALVNMLVAKNKSGMVAEVMHQFQRIYYQLNPT